MSKNGKGDTGVSRGEYGGDFRKYNAQTEEVIWLKISRFWDRKCKGVQVTNRVIDRAHESQTIYLSTYLLIYVP